MTDEPTRTSIRALRSIGRFLPALVLATGFVLFFALDLQRYVSFEALHEHREWLLGQVEVNKALAAFLFMLLYAVVVAFSIPGATVMSISAGFLFGTIIAVVCAVIGGTLGAVCLFLAARTAFQDTLRAKAGMALKRMEAGFRQNALNYLLFLRLVPIFPFWLVNLVPAFLGVSLRVYFFATLFGVIPGSLVFTSLGNGLGEILDSGGTPDLGIIFKPSILLPILGLAALAVLPVAYKKIKARRLATG